MATIESLLVIRTRVIGDLEHNISHVNKFTTETDFRSIAFRNIFLKKAYREFVHVTTELEKASGYSQCLNLAYLRHANRNIQDKYAGAQVKISDLLRDIDARKSKSTLCSQSHGTTEVPSERLSASEHPKLQLIQHTQQTQQHHQQRQEEGHQLNPIEQHQSQQLQKRLHVMDGQLRDHCQEHAQNGTPSFLSITQNQSQFDLIIKQRVTQATTNWATAKSNLERSDWCSVSNRNVMKRRMCTHANELTSLKLEAKEPRHSRAMPLMHTMITKAAARKPIQVQTRYAALTKSLFAALTVNDTNPHIEDLAIQQLSSEKLSRIRTQPVEIQVQAKPDRNWIHINGTPTNTLESKSSIFDQVIVIGEPRGTSIIGTEQHTQTSCLPYTLNGEPPPTIKNGFEISAEISSLGLNCLPSKPHVSRLRQPLEASLSSRRERSPLERNSSPSFPELYAFVRLCEGQKISQPLLYKHSHLEHICQHANEQYDEFAVRTKQSTLRSISEILYHCDNCGQLVRLRQHLAKYALTNKKCSVFIGYYRSAATSPMPTIHSIHIKLNAFSANEYISLSTVVIQTLFEWHETRSLKSCNAKVNFGSLINTITIVARNMMQHEPFSTKLHDHGVNHASDSSARHFSFRYEARGQTPQKDLSCPFLSRGRTCNEHITNIHRIKIRFKMEVGSTLTALTCTRAYYWGQLIGLRLHLVNCTQNSEICITSLQCHHLAATSLMSITHFDHFVFNSLIAAEYILCATTTDQARFKWLPLFALQLEDAIKLKAMIASFRNTIIHQYLQLDLLNTGIEFFMLHDDRWNQANNIDACHFTSRCESSALITQRDPPHPLIFRSQICNKRMSDIHRVEPHFEMKSVCSLVTYARLYASKRPYHFDNCGQQITVRQHRLVWNRQFGMCCRVLRHTIHFVVPSPMLNKPHNNVELNWTIETRCHSCVLSATKLYPSWCQLLIPLLLEPFTVNTKIDHLSNTFHLIKIDEQEGMRHNSFDATNHDRKNDTNKKAASQSILGENNATATTKDFHCILTFRQLHQFKNCRELKSMCIFEINIALKSNNRAFKIKQTPITRGRLTTIVWLKNQHQHRHVSSVWVQWNYDYLMKFQTQSKRKQPQVDLHIDQLELTKMSTHEGEIGENQHIDLTHLRGYSNNANPRPTEYTCTSFSLNRVCEQIVRIVRLFDSLTQNRKIVGQITKLYTFPDPSSIHSNGNIRTLAGFYYEDYGKLIIRPSYYKSQEQLKHDNCITILHQNEGYHKSGSICNWNEERPKPWQHKSIQEPKPSRNEIPMIHFLDRQSRQQNGKGFWDEWHHEFLSRLQRQPKWKQPQAGLRIDQMSTVKRGSHRKKRKPLSLPDSRFLFRLSTPSLTEQARMSSVLNKNDTQENYECLICDQSLIPGEDVWLKNG